MSTSRCLNHFSPLVLSSSMQETDSDMEHDLYKLTVAEFKASVTDLLKEYLSTGSLEGA